MDRLYRVHGYIMYQCNHFHVEHGTANIWRLRKVKSMRLIDADKISEAKFHPLPYTHITPTDVDAESYKRGWNDAIDAIITEEPTAEEPHWIPCSVKNPPEEAKRYWVCTDGGYQCQCRWTNVNYFWDNLTTNWKWHFMDIPQYSKVVAWMPLPEPWDGGDSE